LVFSQLSLEYKYSIRPRTV